MMSWWNGLRNRVAGEGKASSEESRFALALLQQGNLLQAEAEYQRWCLVDPVGHEALINAAVVALLRRHWNEALSALEAVIRLDGDLAEALTMLGTTWIQLGDPEQALTFQQRALEIDPQLPEAHRGRADALRALGCLSQAISAYEMALQIRPEYVQAQWNLATTLLLAGEYERGWQLYGARFSPRVGVQPIAASSLPIWPGGVPQRGDSLLLIAEQGLGDTIQFARYLPLLRDWGVQVSLAAQPQLQGLLGDSGISLGSTTSRAWLPLMSLPALLGVTPQSPMVVDPYLRAPAALPEGLQRLRADGGTHLVALNWQGNPGIEISNFSGRSLPLEAFSPLASVPGVEFVSVQKGYGSDQLDVCSFRDCFSACQPLIDRLMDFRDMASVICQCDLLITSDTAVAHLAGAIGHPTWLLLQKVPDWRWGMEGETSFWYPSMRLFRQDVAGNWDGVMQRVSVALSEFVATT